MPPSRKPGPIGTDNQNHHPAFGITEHNRSEQIVVEGLGAAWAGTHIKLNGRTALRLTEGDFYFTGTFQEGMKMPKSGKSTYRLFIYRKDNPKQVFGLDYHRLKNHGPKPKWHYNIAANFGTVKGLQSVNHNVTPGAANLGKLITVFRMGGQVLFAVGGAMSLYEIYYAENRPRQIAIEVVGWSAGTAAAARCFPIGVRSGASAALVFGQLGPQVATPEELVTVPAGSFIGGVLAGISCGTAGFVAGSTAMETVYDWIFTPLEKEEYVLIEME